MNDPILIRNYLKATIKQFRLIKMVRKWPEQVEQFLDGNQGVLILSKVSCVKAVLFKVRRCLGQSSQLQQVDKVKVLQPIRTLHKENKTDYDVQVDFGLPLM